MEISTGAHWAFELKPVCAQTPAFSFGLLRRRGAFALLPTSTLIASNSRLDQPVRSTWGSRAQGKLSL